jgi:hypothetical protein
VSRQTEHVAIDAEHAEEGFVGHGGHDVQAGLRDREPERARREFRKSDFP